MPAVGFTAKLEYIDEAEILRMREAFTRRSILEIGGYRFLADIFSWGFGASGTFEVSFDNIMILSDGAD